MNEKEKYIEIYSGEIGKNYEQRHGEGYGRGFWGEGIIKYVKSLQPKSVLDVGCGYGRFCNAITDFVDKVYGIDIGSVVTGNVIKNDKINFIDAEAKNIPLADGEVEWITSFDCLEHALPEDIDDIFKEFNRVATKGFILSISYVSDCHHSLNLHMTVQPEEWWIEKISKYGEIKREGIIGDGSLGYSYIIVKKQNKIMVNIPKAIYQTYHSDISLNAINHIKELNPDFDYVFFNNTDCIEFLTENYDEKIVNTFNILRSGAHKADLFRYCLLLKNGGIYIDIDIQMEIGFSDILKKCSEANLVTSKSAHSGDGLYQGFLISTPNNEILKMLIENIVANPNPEDYGYYIKYFGTLIKQNANYFKNLITDFSPFNYYEINKTIFYMFKELMYIQNKYCTVDENDTVLFYANGHNYPFN